MITFANFLSELQNPGRLDRHGERSRETLPRRKGPRPEPTPRENNERAGELWRVALKAREEAHAKQERNTHHEEGPSASDDHQQMRQALEAASARCAAMIAEAEIQLKRAKQAEYEFEFRSAEVEKGFKLAKIACSEADTYRK